MDYEQLDFLSSQEDSQGTMGNSREGAMLALIDRGISYTTNNDGIHLIISHAGLKCDFWPGTGYWRFRDGAGKGRGVFTLIGLLEHAANSAEPDKKSEEKFPVQVGSGPQNKAIKNMPEKSTPPPVAATKQLRKDLDEVLQRLKKDVAEQRSSRERSQAITKIQEAIMWLGMDLKAQAEEGAEDCKNPYPHSYDPKSETINPTADGLKL